MVSMEEILQISNDIKAFCHNHERVFIYGAGNWGQQLYHILKKEGINPQGFVITNGVPHEVLGCQVLPVDSALNQMGSECGVIVAFREADIVNIRFLIDGCADVLFFPPSIFGRFLSLMKIKGNLSLVDYREIKKYEKKSWNNILIIRLDVIGDLIITTPFIRELRRNYPASHITLVVNKNNESLFKNCPYINELLLYEFQNPYEPNKTEQFLAYHRASAFAEKYLRHQTNDIVFLPRNILDGRNALEELYLAYESGADFLVGRINNLNNNMGLIYETLKSRFSLISYELEEKHEARYMLDMLEKCGGIIREEREELWPAECDERFAYEVLPSDKFLYIAIALVGSTESRNWPLDNYIKMIQQFEKRHGNRIKFVLLGGPNAIVAASSVMSGVNSMNVINLTGKTDLSQAAAIMKRCCLYIGADTGLMHMASAMCTPVVEIGVSLPGHTAADGSVPERMGPWKVDYIAMQASKGLDECTGVCSKSYPHCITQIEVEDVIAAAEKLLQEVAHIDLPKWSII